MANTATQVRCRVFKTKGASVSANYGFRAVFLVTAFVVLFNAVYSTLTLGRVRRQRATDNPGSGNHSVN